MMQPSHTNTHTNADRLRNSDVSIHFCVIYFCHKSSSCANGYDDLLAEDGGPHKNSTLIRHSISSAIPFFFENNREK